MAWNYKILDPWKCQLGCAAHFFSTCEAHYSLIQTIDLICPNLDIMSQKLLDKKIWSLILLPIYDHCSTSFLTFHSDQWSGSVILSAPLRKVSPELNYRLPLCSQQHPCEGSRGRRRSSKEHLYKSGSREFFFVMVVVSCVWDGMGWEWVCVCVCVSEYLLIYLLQSYEQINNIYIWDSIVIKLLHQEMYSWNILVYPG